MATKQITTNITLSDHGPETCVSTKLLAEIIERLQGTVSFDDPNVLVLAKNPPKDLSVIWGQQNSQGQVVAIKYFDPLTGKWEHILTTNPDEQKVPVCSGPGVNNALRYVGDCLFVDGDLILKRSANSDNLIQFDDQGHLIVNAENIRDVANQLDTSNKCNVLQKNPSSFAMSVDKGAKGFQHIANSGGDLISGFVITRNDPNDAVRTFDLTTVPGINWDADCPPTHAQVQAAIIVGTGDGFSSGTWADPAVVISVGADACRLAVAMDSDGTEGACVNTAFVRLNQAAPELLTYLVKGRGTVNWGASGNELSLYLQGLIWGTV